jgi:hypothetical protein
MFRVVKLMVVAGLALWHVQTAAAEIRVVPGDMTLNGPHAHQRLLVLRSSNRTIDGDLSSVAKYVSSDPGIASVDEEGTVRAVSDGKATITARHDAFTASAQVTVQKTKDPFTWDFDNHVMPVLTRIGCNSGACHGALAGKGGFKLSLRGYAPADDHFVLTRQALGRRVNLLEPAQSLMLRKPTLAVSHGGGLKLDIASPEFRLLADWIASGAPGPKKHAAKIQRLEVFPPAIVLKPKDTMQVVVRAWYSDGRSEDVTRWAKFSSTEDLVATVDEDGKVTVAGTGEAAVTVQFSNLVALSRITVPLANSIDPRIFAAAPRKSYVDDLVNKKLQTLRIPPSSSCNDQEFVRRAYLDAAGILPTPEEVKKFVADPAPDRRAKLVDALLSRAEFVDYWTYKWSDVLLISSRRLTQPAMWAFYQYVRQSVADNKPWDQFAREILTARGSNLQNGAANYFVLHKDVTDLTETTAVTFLGTSITCARCHNHPLEKWTQDQYWSMASLFARVGIKNGDRAGEVAVQSLPEGEVLHLRRGLAMPPTPLDGKPLSPTSGVDRRHYFADWLTAKDNPYFAPALVNRVWRNFMGRGLVEAEDDLRQTNPPSNEELLDALARDFIANRYDVKHLVRTIMNSAAYQRSSTPLPGNVTDDRFYSRYLIRRLSAEVVLDAYAQVTGVPTEFTQLQVGSTGGFAKTTSYPLGTRALQLPDPQVVSQFLDSFGRPERVQTCSCERQHDSTIGQALHLNNGKTLNDKLRAKTSRIETWLEERISDEEAIRRIFLLGLGRQPTTTEMTRFTTLMTEAARDPQSTRREVLEDLFWAVLTGREFLFNR